MELDFILENVIKSRLNLIVTAISFSLIFLLFLLNVVYKLTVGNKKRFFVFCSLGVVVVAEGIFTMQSISVLLSLGIPFFIMAFGEIIFLKCLSGLIGEKKIIVTNEEKRLIEDLDNQIEREENENIPYFFDNPFIQMAKSAAENNDREKRAKTIAVRKDDEEYNNKSPVNFSHIKNVIKILKDCDLSSADRKKVEELSVVLNAEEKEDGNFYNEKINNVLETLLKLMSKYKTQ